MENKCENLSLYIIDQLSEHEKEQFKRHLKTCAHCQNELESLQDTWQTLSYDMEEVDAPESLKMEVMDFIFKEDEKESPHNPIKLFLTKHFSPLSAGITAILIIGFAGLLWYNLHLKDTITALEEQMASPAQIVRTFNLKGQDIASSANGTAYLLQEGHDNSLIIELNNMPGIKDDEVYQVWLLNNGNRQNAGTIKPDQNGNGLITYRMPKDQSFDDIGITLEPNPNNTQPKGRKVMGTT
ncbi:anti-sigma factor [Bacillus sp. FJAT-49705]|uniref:Anti-sigma-W factor RsiW n=1 Tax=Cytobacillus citreus TaxID=2833586 RepID=A0ABS5NZ71_9BACI|nr:anti-sigma factor [Cytobacillus citreus]MBS4193127.1 anti-sigma factor [Cytobacillus citreus]